MPRFITPYLNPLAAIPRNLVRAARQRGLEFKRGTLFDADTESGDALGIAAILTRREIPDGPITVAEAAADLGDVLDATCGGLIAGFDGRPLPPNRSADYALAWNRGMEIAKAAGLPEPACGWPSGRRDGGNVSGPDSQSNGIDPLCGGSGGVVAGIGRFFGKGRGR